MRRSFFVFFASIFVVFGTTLCAEEGSQKWVLVVGGAGFIGSHVNEMLHRSGYHTVVIDNLDRGSKASVLHGVFVEGDIGNKEILDEVFSSYPIDAVMHFAASTEVGESMQDPLKYYQNNVAATLTLLEAVRKYHVNVFIFSSTAAIFGIPETEFVSETHPCRPISPYGRSKLMVEMVLNDLAAAESPFRFTCLRYFNVAGGDPRGEIKNRKTKEANLIQTVLRNVQQGLPVTIFGDDYETFDGTAIRDYIHIEDLGRAHIAAMERLFSGAPSSCYNLGNGKGYSIHEVIHAAEKVTGKPIKTIISDRRAGDIPVLVASSKKAERELNWYPEYTSLEGMIMDAWRALQKN